MWWVETFTGGCGGYVVGGWLDQVGIRLSQLSTKLKLKLSLAKIYDIVALSPKV